MEQECGVQEHGVQQINRNRPCIHIFWQNGLEDRLMPVQELLQVHFPMLSFAAERQREPAVSCYDPSRYQYDAAGLLRELPDDGICLHLLHVDLYYPGYRYLYGAAVPGKAVVSDFRPDTAAGFYKEICHELGHALGLNHCKNKCIMHVSRSEWELEQKQHEFCSSCQKQLYRLTGLQKIKEYQL